jgi:hypothetical protein
VAGRALTSGVEGTAVSPLGRQLGGYECEGPVVPVGSLCDAEFAVSPADLSWAMLYTHEDHALGGPYFVRREWLPAIPAEPPYVLDDLNKNSEGGSV